LSQSKKKKKKLANFIILHLQICPSEPTSPKK
jgi:hypothetical protein